MRGESGNVASPRSLSLSIARASLRVAAIMNTSRYRERLIDEVKKYPVLYDTRHENHRDIDVRDHCWVEISERLGANSEVLKREWKILRDSMRQALKRSRHGTTTKAGLPCKKWRFQNRMAFVLPYMTVRRNTRQMKEEVKAVDSEVHSEPEPEPEVEAWEPTSSDHEALELFFASVCQSTKRLSKKYQALMKRQVLDALLRIEEEADNDPGETKEVIKNF